MWLQPCDVLVVQEFSIVFYLCLAAVFWISLAIAFKLIRRHDGED
jgi:hypothetical protein